MPESGLRWTPASIAVAAAYAGALTPPDPRPVPSALVPVEFTAPDSGVGQLTWGQMEIWLAMTRQGWMPFGGVEKLAPGTTVDDVADELRYLMTRYPSFRTRLRFAENGRPIQQEVFGSGTVMLEVYDADSDGDAGGDGDSQGAVDAADATATAVYRQYRTAPRDFTGEWPVRMGVVRWRGEPVRLIVQNCHLVSDGGGVEVFLRDLAVRETAPPTGMNTLELARWQHSEAGQRLHAAAERYWRKVIGSLPPLPPRATDPRTPRHWSGLYESPALNLAVPLIAERTRVDSSTVFLALYAIALGRTGVLNPAVIRPLSANRYREGIETIVTHLVQSGICMLDVADMTVDEAVRRTKRAAMATFKYSYWDAEKMEALIQQTEAALGPHPGLRNFANDRRAGRPFEPPGEPVTAQRLKEAVEAASFRWIEKKDNAFEPLFLHIEDAPGRIALQMCGDTHHVSPAEIEALARTMETVAVEAALDPEAVTGVPAARAVRAAADG